MSDVVIVVNTVVGGIVAVFTGVMAYQTLKLNLMAKNAAVEVKDVKATLRDSTQVFTHKLDDIARTGEDAAKIGVDTHTLVNSQMGAQKKLLAVTARAKAVITNEKMDLEAAERAEADLAEHELKQQRVDDKKEQRP